MRVVKYGVNAAQMRRAQPSTVLCSWAVADRRRRVGRDGAESGKGCNRFMNNSSDMAEKMASLLAEARRAGHLIDNLPQALEPKTMAEGYRVQDAFCRIWPAPLAGWKVGATAVPVQQKFGVEEPFCGPFFAPDVSASPARLPAARFAHRLIESEIALRFGRDIAPQSAPIGRAAILAAIDAVIPAFEIVSPRFPELLFGRAPTAAADCGLNAAIVLGQLYAAWRDLDLAALKVTLRVDGVMKGEGNGANVLGSPLNVLDWFVSHLSGRGIALAAGSVVLTGTTTGIVALAPGETASADFGPLGSIEMAFTGPPYPASARQG